MTEEKQYCIYCEECADGAECDRALTAAIIKEAGEEGVSVDMSGKRPDCFVKKVGEQD